MKYNLILKYQIDLLTYCTYICASVRSQSSFFDLTQVSQVVTNRLDLSRSSTWIFSTKLEKLENVQFSMVPNMEALMKL